jgi:transcriptional regulator with XRE-family HTH domain
MRYTQNTSVGSRREALTQLRSEALAANITDDAKFHELIARCRTVLEMTDRDISEALNVSRPTVSRWIAGKNLPHRAMRKPIFTVIARASASKLRLLEPDDRVNNTDAPNVTMAARAR